jgi:Tfp pilus assembly protein PilO
MKTLPVAAGLLPSDGHADAQLPADKARSPLARVSASAIVPYLAFGASRLGKTGIVGVSLLICSTIVFFASNLPLRDALSEKAAQLEAARDLASDKRSGLVAETPRQQAQNFVERLPSPSDIPEIMASVVAIAATAGIELDRGSYDLVSADPDAISRYQMSLPVTGSYPEVRKFIEDVLAAEPAISLEKMRIERDAVTDQVIAADLMFAILLGGA